MWNLLRLVRITLLQSCFLHSDAVLLQCFFFSLELLSLALLGSPWTHRISLTSKWAIFIIWVLYWCFFNVISWSSRVDIFEPFRCNDLLIFIHFCEHCKYLVKPYIPKPKDILFFWLELRHFWLTICKQIKTKNLNRAIDVKVIRK